MTDHCVLGVAWALSDDLHEGLLSKVVRKWPASEGHGYRPKVPSRISYRQSRETACDWGLQCQSGPETYSWTKLLLGIQSSSDRDSNTNRFDDPILDKATRMGILKLPDGKSAVDVIADFLRHINEYALAYVSKLLGERRDSVEGIDFWIAVPATWSSEQRSLMRHAAQRAGFGSRAEDRVFFLSESEAAMHVVPSLRGVDLQVSVQD